MTYRLLRTALVWLLCLVAFAATARADVAPIFDWGVRNVSEPGITAIPHPGHDWPATHYYYTDLWTLNSETGRYTGLMLHNDTGPYDGTKPDTLSTVLNWFSAEGIRLDYVFADVETDTTYQNTVVMTQLVRGHADPLVNSARLVQYAYYPGATDYSQIWTHTTDRTEKHQNYLSSGVDVANPNCYPYSYMEVHTRTSIWGSFVSPNERSALFWAPLERFSVAKRNLPEGHQLIPWLAGYIPWDNYPSVQPTTGDMDYLLKHMRLRGADGYYTLVSWNDAYTNEEYRAAMNVLWHGLDWFFDRPGEAEAINLATHKVEGAEWSGYRKGNLVLAALSNLAGSARSVDIPAYDGLPDRSPTVAAGTHVTMRYLLDRRGDEYFDDRPTTTPLTEQGFYGASPQDFRLAAPLGSGNTSSTVLTTASDGYVERTWWETGTPAVSRDDTVVYSAWMYGAYGNGFGPVAIDDYVAAHNREGYVDTARMGPYVMNYWGRLRVRRTAVAGDPWQSTNIDFDANSWYEVQLVCVPGEGTDVAGMVYVRNLTAGQEDYTQVIFDKVTTGTVEQELTVPLQFTDLANPATFNGWQVYLYNQTQQIDNLWATLYTYLDTAEGASHLYAAPGTYVPVPEPATLLLTAGALLITLRKRR